MARIKAHHRKAHRLQCVPVPGGQGIAFEPNPLNVRRLRPDCSGDIFGRRKTLSLPDNLAVFLARQSCRRRRQRTDGSSPATRPTRQIGPFWPPRVSLKAAILAAPAITPCQHSAGAERGGTRDRVRPARETLFRARVRSRTAETPRGSVHESPVQRMPHAQRYSDI